MPPQTRSKHLIHNPMGSSSVAAGDAYDESSNAFHGKENEDWDFRYGTPIRPPLQKRKWVDMAVQTDDIVPETLPPLCHDTASSTNSPDPESDEDGSYSSKGSNKRKKSITSSQPSKKAKPASPAKATAASPKTPRRESVVSLDGTGSKPRSIYAPSPTPLQCSYVYPLALGPPRRPVDLRRAKGARIMPEVQAAQTALGENGEAPAPMDVDALHKITHRCPITFSREFEMRRHIRTVHIAEEIRAVVEGRLPREQATVIPDSWDGKTLLSKPTCAGCGTTFSRPDAVRRHQTEVNAKMENGICIECPGPKVHIRRGPRKDIFATDEAPLVTLVAPAPPVLASIAPAPVPAPAPIPAPVPDPVPVTAAAPVSAPVPVPTSAPATIPVMIPAAPYPPAMMAAAAAAAAAQPVAAPTPAAGIVSAAAPGNPAQTPAPTVVAPPTADTAAPATAPTDADSQLPKAVGERAEPAEGELESEDDM
ncbi:C2H2 zinc finger [Ceratobasidium sp. AG-Ba]|nr:C2H2 zinc finger [Ceratobasidium sp. AG-Ba]